MITCIICALLLTKSWTYSCIFFLPMILCCFINSLDNGGVFNEYGPIGGHSLGDL
jgi:hypothetical protein